jgi:hypothetical protein
MFFILALSVPLILIAVLPIRCLSGGGQCDADRIELFLSGESLSDHYRPLERLLRNSDVQFLASQPGVTPSRVRQFRAQRRKLFRQYLASLVADFGAVCFLMKALMIQSAMDRPDLYRALRKARLSFFASLFQIEIRLCAHAIGFSGISIETRGLLIAMEAIGSQARMLQFNPAPSPAY